MAHEILLPTELVLFQQIYNSDNLIASVHFINHHMIINCIPNELGKLKHETI
jgi:hypothetical protein